MKAPGWMKFSHAARAHADLSDADLSDAQADDNYPDLSDAQIEAQLARYVRLGLTLSAENARAVLEDRRGHPGPRPEPEAG